MSSKTLKFFATDFDHSSSPTATLSSFLETVMTGFVVSTIAAESDVFAVEPQPTDVNITGISAKILSILFIKIFGGETHMLACGGNRL